MLFLIRATDGDDGERIRREALNEHLAWVERHLEAIRVAGPLCDGEQRMRGSAYVVDAPDRDAALAFIGDDPYYRRGLWSSIECTAFRAAAGTWVGGATWKAER